MIKNKVRVGEVKSNLMEIVRQILRSFEEHKQVGRELIKKPSRVANGILHPQTRLN